MKNKECANCQDSGRVSLLSPAVYYGSAKSGEFCGCPKGVKLAKKYAIAEKKAGR